MPDIPGNNSTTATLTVGGSVTDTIEVVGDHDWFRINLTSGQSITVALNAVGASGLEDPYLRIRDSSGNLLWENDDGGAQGLDSLLSFTASYSGVYFIDVGAWDADENGPGDYTGNYQVSVTTYTPPSTGTNDQLAAQLTHGYWGGSSHRFNVGPGGSLTVNLTALTADGQSLARSALALWTDVIGVNFIEVSSGGQITFDDDEEGAHATAQYSGGITSSAQVNVDAQWLADYGTALNGYAFQTYVHEIGHALGLGHQGGYNGEANYPYDASFANDSWAVSVMSYFDQTESTYYAGQGFTHAYAANPMVADIIAMGNLYGLSTTTRLGDTTYGHNSTSNRAIHNASQYTNVALTIIDSGGNDTINYSLSSANQLINLSPETFSNVNGEVGNLVIARGTIIENAIGGSGSDVLRGNSVSNTLTGNAGADQLFGNDGGDMLIGGLGFDTLTGGAGADTFRDTIGGLAGDTIVDFSVGDSIIFTTATIGSFSFSLSGTTLTFSGGSLTLTTIPTGTITASAAAGGGVQLTLTTTPAAPPVTVGFGAGDFNGDGRDDILWRHDSGAMINWLGQANGGFVANADANAGTDWHVVGIGDFNGDNRSDVLFRNNDGGLTDWLGQSNGSFASNFGNAYYQVENSWNVAGTGDFNGDGRDDILWRHSNGAMINWRGQANGGFISTSDANAGTDWNVAGTGDFNGDGRDDVLWRNNDGSVTNWLGQANGSFASNFGNAYYQVSNSWTLAGTGDFNGDGRDDILWRNTNGAMINWLGQANGGFVSNADANAGTDWNIASIGDFNGDGRDDILWRNNDGSITNWLGQANGSFASNFGNAYYQVSNSWDVQPVSDYLV